MMEDPKFMILPLALVARLVEGWNEHNDGLDRGAPTHGHSVPGKWDGDAKHTKGSACQECADHDLVREYLRAPGRAVSEPVGYVTVLVTGTSTGCDYDWAGGFPQVPEGRHALFLNPHGTEPVSSVWLKQLRDEFVAQGAEIVRLREHLAGVKSSRDAFGQNAIDLRTQLTGAHALLREVVALDPRGEFLGWELDGSIDAALSASAEPSTPECVREKPSDG